MRNGLFVLALFIGTLAGCGPAAETKPAAKNAPPAHKQPAAREDSTASEQPTAEENPPLQAKPAGRAKPAQPSADLATETDSPASRKAESPPRQALSQAEMVQADASRLQNAFVAGDGATFIELSYPKIIEAMGGGEKAKAAVDQAMAKMQTMGMAILSLTFPEPPTFFSSAEHDFVFVPTRSVFAINGDRIQSQSFLLGVKPLDAAKWTYIDGSQVSDDNVHDWFADFPAGHSCPKTDKKKL